MNIYFLLRLFKIEISSELWDIFLTIWFFLCNSTFFCYTQELVHIFATHLPLDLFEIFPLNISDVPIGYWYRRPSSRSYDRPTPSSVFLSRTPTPQAPSTLWNRWLDSGRTRPVQQPCSPTGRSDGNYANLHPVRRKTRPGSPSVSPSCSRRKRG